LQLKDYLKVLRQARGEPNDSKHINITHNSCLISQPHELDVNGIHEKSDVIFSNQSY